MFALLVSVWAGSGCQSPGPESRDHPPQSPSQPRTPRSSLHCPALSHPPLKLPCLAPTVADWTRGAARSAATIYILKVVKFKYRL